MSSYKLEATANESWKHIVPLITGLNSFKTEQADDQSRCSSFHERLNVGVIIQPPPGPARPSGGWLTDDSCTGLILVCSASERCCSVPSALPKDGAMRSDRRNGFAHLTDLQLETQLLISQILIQNQKAIKIYLIIISKIVKPRKRSLKGQALITYGKKTPHHSDK